MDLPLPRWIPVVWALLAAPLLGSPAELTAEDVAQSPKVWNVDRLDRLGDHKATVVGTPRVIETDAGKAVEFDGEGDALFLDVNPLAGLAQFTVEIVFRPAADGPKEQRFLHFQEAGSESRLLFETRLTDDGRWFLDTFLKSGDINQTLFAEKSQHAIGPWYHAAVVVDGKSMQHYVDGKLELEADLTQPAAKVPAWKPLGQGQTSLGVRINKLFWYKGAVRQIRITPRALEAKDFSR